MVPLCDPGPIEHSHIPIHAAAVRCARARSSWPCSRGRRGGSAEIGRKLVARYRGLVTDVEFNIPATTAREQGLLHELVQDIRRDAA